MNNEQKAHDLAVAYITYVYAKSNEDIDIEAFFQEYEQAFDAFSNLINRNY